MFFFRKRRLQKKLFKSGYLSLWEVMDQMLVTDERDWELEKRRMTHSFFKDTTIVFSDFIGLSVSVYEGSERVFQVSYFDDSDKVAYGYDYTTKKYLSEKEKFRMKHILLHLEKSHKRLKQREWHQKKSAKKAEKKWTQRTQEKNIQNLRCILKEQVVFADTYEENDYVLHLSENHLYDTLTISFKGTTYYHAMYFKKTEILETIIYQKHTEDANVFRELLPTLNRYAKNLFVCAQQKKQVNHPIIRSLNSSFQAVFQEKVTNIKQSIVELEKEEQWLSIETTHCISETIPNDITTLCELYQQVRDKEKIREDVRESLHAVQQKIDQFIQEAEQNKYKEIQKRRQLIENR